MFRKQDFKKVDLLGSGKKNTKIYKALHQPSGKYYALKEVEAKTLDKLNEYKEEAVQLFKAQTHPNIIQFYGYFFYETMYNTFRIGIVCEYIEHKMNLEYVFRKRKQLNVFWKQDELEKMITSLIKTLSYMQTVGLCHRDLKPANLFLMNNGEIKVIDFGESKDYFMEADDGGEGTNATIRGTPQYLSPILWKAHVVDGNSRFAKHNIYKSDVFSVGLLFYQLASMEDVTGFNQKSPEFDGEKLIDQGLKKLKSRYNDSIIEVLRLMLKFHEVERPSFIELEKLILASESSKQLIDTTVVAQFVSVKAANAKIQLSNQKQALKENIQNNENKGIQKQKTNMLAETPIQHKRAKSNQNFYGGNNNFTETSNLPEKQYEDEEMVGNPKYNLLTQAELFKNYNEQNQLYTHQSMKMWWFEFGGNKIGRILLDITQAPPMKEDTYSDCTRGNGKSLQPASNAFRWKLIGKYKNEFPQHFTMVFLSEEKGVYILGGNGNHNTCLYYDLKTIKIKAPMPQEKTFFAAIFHKGIIYTFGGYDAYDKVQISNCEYYNVDNDQWHNSPHDNTEGNVEYKLHKERSQCSCCVFDDETIFIFGGYHRSEGTLNSIEKFNIKTRKIELMELKMPSPLRRFQCLKISQTKILLLGGILRMSKESDAVFCFDLEKEYTIEQLDKIEKPGIIDYPIILDQIGNLHLFLETNSGTSPPAHVVYSFLEYS